MFLSKENKEKFRRIEELKDHNFNIPRFRFLPINSKEKDIEDIFIWAKEINNPDQIYNIRTYSYSNISKKESAQNPHITDLSLDSLKENLPKFNSDYSCLIDAEIPDNGRLAGNILIEEEDNSFTIEYVVKEKRAMVRDINKEKFFSISGNYIYTRDKIKYDSADIPDLPFLRKNQIILILNFIINKSLNLKRNNIILEFTYFSTPSGIFYNNLFPEDNIVFWEYRGR